MNFRMIAALVFLILLLTFGILQEVYLDKVFEDFESRLSDISNVTTGYYDVDKIEATQQWWQKKHSKMEMFLPHIPLNDIAAALGELKGAAMAEDYEAATAMVNKLEALVDSIAEMSSVRIGNIL